jgi:integration host factor subunit beta
MIKSELIASLTSKLNQIPEKDVTLSVNLLLDVMSDTLSKGERIEIRGFGSFSLHYRAPRNAHNPKTGERLVTAAKYSPHFKPGKEMRERINSSAAEHLIQDEDRESD